MAIITTVLNHPSPRIGFFNLQMTQKMRFIRISQGNKKVFEATKVIETFQVMEVFDVTEEIKPMEEIELIESFRGFNPSSYGVFDCYGGEGGGGGMRS